MHSIYARDSLPSKVRVAIRSALLRAGILDKVRPLYRKAYESISKNRTVLLEMSGVQCSFTIPTLDYLEATADFWSEAEELGVFLNYVDEDSVMWDIGANAGLYSVFA